jgi:uncharacterized membrane protein
MPDLTTPPSSASDTGLPSNVGAGLCAIFTLLGGIIFYFIEKKDQFVRHWAIEAIFFGAAWILAHFAVMIIGAVFGHLPVIGLLFALLTAILSLIVSLGGLVLWILGIIKAFQGQRWEYPFISAQGRKLFPKLVV